MQGVIKINRWVDRISRFVDEIGSWDNRRNFIKRNCRYGMANFCDGRPNPGYVKAEDMERKPPCKYFKNGKCTFEKILEGRKENI